MSHYVCSECKGASSVPKVCETEGCTKKDQRLAECVCTDGQHTEANESPNATPDQIA